ncbi:fidgetin isoform X1 [Rhinoraja longicauda]
MISSANVYGLKMQWTPEHAQPLSQWPEQHFDISSTTRSPAHKADVFRGHLQRTYQYAWANDDISALTASNLLKKYAEKYSGILEGPSERSILGSYVEGPPGLSNGRKAEGEGWQTSVNSDGVYSMACVPDVISGGKAGVGAAAEASGGIGSSPGVPTNLPEPSYSNSTCGSLHSGLPAVGGPQDYAAAYNGSYLHSSYAGQPSPHPSGLLQPPPSLVSAYTTGSPNLSAGAYNYPAAAYSSQAPTGPGYTSGSGPPSTYLPAGIAAPTPLPPTTVPGYGYQGHGLTPVAPTPLLGSPANSLKRKAFYMAGQGEMEAGYGPYGYGHQRTAHSPMYRMVDGTMPNAGFERSPDTVPLAFKPAKQLMVSEQQRKFGGQPGRAATPPSSSYAKTSLGPSRTAEGFGKFTSLHPVQGPAGSGPNRPADEQLKKTEAHLIELVSNEIISQAPPLDWGDIAGLEMAKAAVKEEVLWPMLRPDVFTGLGAPPRSLLLFGPQGTGKTLLGRCIANQLGASFFRINGSALISKWLGEGDKVIQASFLVARCRQPAVVFISEADLLLSSQVNEESSPIGRVKTELLVQLDSLVTSLEDQVLVICSTSKPEDLDETARRYFMKRLLIPLPDGPARHQMVRHLLSQHNYCLSDKEIALTVQRAENLSGLDVARLCQEAVVGPLHAMQGTDLSAIMPNQLRPITYQDFDNAFCKIQPSISQKDLDVYVEWNKMFGCSQ